MKKATFFITIVLIASVISCGKAEKQGGDTQILIKTQYGEIKVKLFEETPQHKNNFVKLVNEGFYNDLLFHRVIEHFMIQGGDPDSKNAEPGKHLGGGSLDYTVPAEFVSKYYHKRGALAAARRGGSGNPEKRSSASQFYIVQGEIYSQGELDTLEITKNNKLRNEMRSQYFEDDRENLKKLKENNDLPGFNIRVSELREKADSAFEASAKKFKFTEEQRKIYTTIGGYPSLDGDYSVFGEVVKGLDVLDKIAAVETDPNNRPLEDVKMKIEIVK